MLNTATCLCKKVKLTFKEISPNVGACHCSMCTKWSGGPFLAVDCGTEVNVEGKENIKTYDSSEWASRHFCKECGTNLYYYLKPKSQYIASAGLFKDISKFNFDHQIFVDEKPHFYEFSNKTHNMTGEEVFAANS